jgi:2-polyprenyl-3-methyl-5-hydroxy-6-metoxy-1,4-benzoquinol methylase
MLEPQLGERFLDLACGTGGAALVAARTGADVTGLDTADQLVKAQAAAEEVGVSITFDEGDAQACRTRIRASTPSRPSSG